MIVFAAFSSLTQIKQALTLCAQPCQPLVEDPGTTQSGAAAEPGQTPATAKPGTHLPVGAAAEPGRPQLQTGTAAEPHRAAVTSRAATLVLAAALTATLHLLHKALHRGLLLECVENTSATLTRKCCAAPGLVPATSALLQKEALATTLQRWSTLEL